MRALVAFLVYVLAGPPIGALILSGVAVILMSFGPEASAPLRVSAEEFVRGIALVVAVAYLFGGLQALFVGIVAAATQVMRWPGRASFLAVAVAGLMAGIGFVSWMAANSNTPFLSIQSFLVLGIHVGAAAGCWLVMAGILWLFRRASASAAA